MTATAIAPSLVDRSRRHGLDSVADLHRFLDEARPESVAIGLLDSHQDSSAEIAVAQAVEAWNPSTPVSRSSFVNPEFREYERIATTVLSAYLRPVVSSYLASLEDRLERRTLVMRSSGGLTSTTGAAELAASILLSGPRAESLLPPRAGQGMAGRESSPLTWAEPPPTCAGSRTVSLSLEVVDRFVATFAAFRALPFTLLGPAEDRLAGSMMGGAAGRSSERRRLAGPGRLWAGRHRAHCHRCQPRAGQVGFVARGRY